MDTKLKSKLLYTCTACSLVAAIIGFFYIGAYIWRWVDEELMDTIKLLKQLF